MKKKILKIWGVGLALVLAITLSVGLAVPVSADVTEWSKGEDPFDFPDEGSDGDWFWDSQLEDHGVIAQAINGDLYVYAWDAGDTGDEASIFKSEDGGRTWSETDYDDDGNGDAVVAMAPSTIDADVLYVATATEVFKTEDGDDFEEVGDFAADTGDANITCMTVGYADDEAHIFVGTDSNPGNVWHRHDVSFGGGWTSVNIGDYDTVGTLNVYGIAASPDFDSDVLVAAVVAESGLGTESFVATNRGADAGVWDLVELTDDAGLGGDVLITEASDPVFVEDFDEDDDFEYFVGVCGPVHTGGALAGGIYRVWGEGAGDWDILDDVDADIISLALVGTLGNAMMIAGEEDTATTWVSTDDGDNWDDPDKSASGAGPTYVAIDEDFEEDTGMAWAVVEDSAVSMSEDGGFIFNQIGLIDMAAGWWVTDIATGSDSFMVIDSDSLFRYDGTNWERVWESTQFGGDAIDLVAISPESDDTIFVANVTEISGGPPNIYRSTDNGQDWDELRRQPDDIIWVDSFLPIDDDTLVVGGAAGEVWKTDRNGARPWDMEDTDAGDIFCIVPSPDVDTDDTLLLGDDGAEVWLSTDLGEEWDEVIGGDALNGAETFVAFHPDFGTNDTIFAAIGDEVWMNDEASELDESDWDELDDADAEGLGQASGVMVSDDGTLYVLDYGAGNGLMRCVDPLEELGDDDFEMVDDDLDAGAELTNMLMTSGSNIIWGLDIVDGEVWQYEDTLAVPVTLTSPSNNSTSGREGSVTFHWRELDDADGYEVEIYYQGDLSEDAALDADPIETLGNAGDGVADGEVWAVPAEYQGLKLIWRVRVAEGDPVMSKWSSTWVFTTALTQGQWNPFVGGVPESPSNGATGVSLMPTFAWNAADWATGYEFVLADNANFTSAIASETVTTTVFSLTTELAYGTTYYWKVKAVSATSESEWGTGVFTTMDEPPAPPSPPATQPPPTLTVPAPVQPPPAIPDYLLWTIVGIGAALAIAVIVLIVRTRRPV